MFEEIEDQTLRQFLKYVKDMHVETIKVAFMESGPKQDRELRKLNKKLKSYPREFARAHGHISKINYERREIWRRGPSNPLPPLI